MCGVRQGGSVVSSPVFSMLMIFDEPLDVMLVMFIVIMLCRPMQII